MNLIQEFMGEQIMVEHTIVYHITPQVIKPKFSSAQNFFDPLCESWKINCASSCNPKVKKRVCRNWIGSRFVMGQIWGYIFCLWVSGCFQNNRLYIFLLWDLGCKSLLPCRHYLQLCHYWNHLCIISSLFGWWMNIDAGGLGLNNGYERKLIHKSIIFTVTVYMYLEDCSSKNQTQHVSGVRAHNPNDHADHSIQTIMYIIVLIWFMCHSVGLIVVLLIFHCDMSVSSMQYVFTIYFSTELLAFILGDYLPRHIHTTVTTVPWVATTATWSRARVCGVGLSRTRQNTATCPV